MNGAPIDPTTVYASVCSLNGTGTFTPNEIPDDIERLHQAMPDLRFEVVARTSDGRLHVLHMTAEGTHRGALVTPLGTAPPSGKRLAIRGLEVFEVIDDLIAGVWLAWDWSAAHATLGARLA